MGFIGNKIGMKMRDISSVFSHYNSVLFQILQANKRHAHIAEDTSRHVLSDENIYTHFIRLANNRSGQRSQRFSPKHHLWTAVLSSNWPGI